MSDTDDLDSTGSDKTGAIRKVRTELEKEQLKRELDLESDKRRDRALYSLREEHKKLRESLFDPKKGIMTEFQKELTQIKQVIGIIKWVGGSIGTLILAGLAAAIFGG